MDEFKLNNITLYLTWNCNLRCVHCWIEAGNEHREYIKFKDIKSFLDQAIEMGTRSIRFTGGEPLIAWDTIKKVIEYTNKFGFNYVIETNGTLLNRDRLSFLQKNNVNLAISLNGSNAEENDQFEKYNGAFDKILNTLSIMKELNYEPEEIITCINRSILSKLEDRILFFDSIGINNVKVNIIQNMGRAEEMSGEGKLLNVKDTILAQKVIREIQKKVNLSILLDVPSCMKNFKESRKGVFICGINNMLCVLPNLDLALCGYGTFEKEIILDHITENFNLEECWKTNKKILALRNAKKKRLSGVCHECIHFLGCFGNCRIKSFREYGSWDQPYPDCQYLYENNLFPQSRLIKDK